MSRYGWALIAIVLVCTALAALLIVSSYDPVEAADDRGEALAQTFWIGFVGFVWLVVFVPLSVLIYLELRRHR